MVERDAERYFGRDDYIEKVRAALRTLVSRRWLRAEDVNAIVEQSSPRWDYLTLPWQ